MPGPGTLIPVGFAGAVQPCMSGRRYGGPQCSALLFDVEDELDPNIEIAPSGSISCRSHLELIGQGGQIQRDQASPTYKGSTASERAHTVPLWQRISPIFKLPS